MRLLLILLLVPSLCFAYTDPQEYDVTWPTGGDSFTICSSGCDFTSLSQANSSGLVGHGDVITLQSPGTYAGIGGSDGWTKDGSSGNEIVITADGPVTINSEFRISADYVIVDGYSSGTRNITVTQGVAGESTIRLMGRYITAKGLDIRHTGSDCTNNSNIAIKVQGPSGDPDYPRYIYIYNNDFSDISHKGIYINSGDFVYIRGNIFDCLSDSGTGFQINPHDPDHQAGDITFEGNIVANCGQCSAGTGYGIYIQGDSDADYLRDIDIINNLIFGSEKEGILITTPGPSSGTWRVYNNTFYDNGDGASRHGFKTDNNFTANILYNYNNAFKDNNAGAYQHGTSQTVSNAGTSPTFQSEVEGNANFLKLDPTDTNCLDAGTSSVSAIVTDDIYGTGRPQNAIYDIGAYEHPVAAASRVQGGAIGISGPGLIR